MPKLYKTVNGVSSDPVSFSDNTGAFDKMAEITSGLMDAGFRVIAGCTLREIGVLYRTMKYGTHIVRITISEIE